MAHLGVDMVCGELLQYKILSCSVSPTPGILQHVEWACAEWPTTHYTT